MNAKSHGLHGFLLVLLLFLLPAWGGETRVWTIQNGTTVEGAYVEFEEGHVILDTADGRRLAIPVEAFIAQDQILICELSASVANIEDLLQDPALWTSAPGDWMSRHGSLGLVWVDENISARSQHPCLKFNGQRTWELLAGFADGHASQVIASLYNRGDAGSISADQFKSLLGSSQKALTGWAGSPPSTVRELRGPANTRVYAQAWVRAPHQVILQWSVGANGIPEFIRMRITPAGTTGRASSAAAAAMAIQTSTSTARAPILNSASLRARVRREPNGDLLLPEVPMVDQGQKGYCAAAVTERVLRYYGRDFDQHQVAQMAGSTAEGGTGSDELLSAVSRIARGLDLNFRKLFDMDIQRYLRLIEDYNRAARKKDLQPFLHNNMIDVDLMYRTMDPSTLREVRVARAVDMRQFFSSVQENIGMGVPLLWAVVLGVIEETPALPQAAGGHMRLIIGYNPQTQEILYSDSWGSEHALKRMALADAWTITTGLLTVLPRNVR